MLFTCFVVGAMAHEHSVLVSQDRAGTVAQLVKCLDGL